MGRNWRTFLGCGGAVLLLIALRAAVYLYLGGALPIRPASLASEPAPPRCSISFFGVDAQLEGADALAAWELYLAMRASPSLRYVYNYLGPRTEWGEVVKAAPNYRMEFHDAGSRPDAPLRRFAGVYMGEQAFFVDGIYVGGLEPEVTARFRAFVAAMQSKHRRPN